MKKIKYTDKESEIVAKFGLNLNSSREYEVCRFNAGEAIIKQGEVVDNIYILVEGKIKVCMLAKNGKDLTLCYYIQNGILGDIEFMQENKIASATSVASIPCTCIKVPVEPNEKELIKNNVFMYQLAEGLSKKLLNSSNAYINSALYTAEERLCTYILISEYNGVFSDVLMDVSKIIGISYRHIFRILNDLCVNKVLEKIVTGYKICDYHYLEQKSLIE